MSCGQIALQELGVEVEGYYASEIDKNAIKVTMDNFPNTIQLGDVTQIDAGMLAKLPVIDLVMFGFPCRSLSKATAGRADYNNGLKGISWLFYPCNEILKWVRVHNNPGVKFLVENVDSNNKTDMGIINRELEVTPIVINSNLFSAQDRIRNYWTDINIPPLPDNNELVLKNIMEYDVAEKYFYKQDFDYYGEGKKICATLHINGHDILKRVNSKEFKAPTLTSCRGGNHQKKIYVDGRCRKLTPNEYRKLQTIPEWYKMHVADSHIYNMCGDGWTIAVIKHILSGMIN